MHSYVIVYTILLSLFLQGRFTKMKRAINPDTIMSIGTAYIGFEEKMPTTKAYSIFLKYRITTRKMPNWLVLSMPRQKHLRFYTCLPFFILGKCLNSFVETNIGKATQKRRVIPHITFDRVLPGLLEAFINSATPKRQTVLQVKKNTSLA